MLVLPVTGSGRCRAAEVLPALWEEAVTGIRTLRFHEIEERMTFPYSDMPTVQFVLVPKADVEAANKILEAARLISTCNLDPCVPCICDHGWTSQEHYGLCSDLRDAIAYFDEGTVAGTSVPMSENPRPASG